MTFHCGPETIALLITVPMLAYFLVKWLMQKDTELENRRLAAGKMAAKLQEYGLKRIPEFLLSYSIGDLQTMADKLHSLAELFLSGDGPVMEELEATFSTCLDKKLGTAEGRALISAKLAAVTKAVADVAPAAAAAAAAAAI